MRQSNWEIFKKPVQKIIIMEGPDGCGKTNIGKALAEDLGIPYFKAENEKEYWRTGDESFLNALRYDQKYISQFLEQTGYSVIIDRAYPSEYVYSQVYHRKTDFDALREIDEKFAEMGAKILLCMRHSYDCVDDELISNEKLHLIDKTYRKFTDVTMCEVMTLLVDHESFTSVSDEIRIKNQLNSIRYMLAEMEIIR